MNDTDFFPKRFHLAFNFIDCFSRNISSSHRSLLSSTGITLGFGILVGIVLSVVLNRVLAAWSGGNSRDPLTLVASALILVLVAVAACLVPAWRAATIDPMRALRTE